MVLLLATTLSACSTPIERRAFSEITFAHLAPIDLDVATIEVISDYQPPLTAANIESEFPVPPATAMARWAADRLRAKGTSGQAIVTIVEASVLEVRLKKSTGLKGFFTNDQSERYDATVRLVVEVFDLSRQMKASAEAEARRSRSVGENITLAAREQAWFSLTEALMVDFDDVMEKQIRNHLSSFLKN